METILYLIESNGIRKHGIHVKHGSDGPCTNILIEAFGALKHDPHGARSKGQPASNVTIETICRVKHARHVKSLYMRNDANRPIRGRAQSKMETNTDNNGGQNTYTRDVPAIQILVKSLGMIEHALCKIKIR